MCATFAFFVSEPGWMLYIVRLFFCMSLNTVCLLSSPLAFLLLLINTILNVFMQVTLKVEEAFVY